MTTYHSRLRNGAGILCRRVTWARRWLHCRRKICCACAIARLRARSLPPSGMHVAEVVPRDVRVPAAPRLLQSRTLLDGIPI
jgi:hypothetical protein